ncbi:uncharacterized protein LOC100182651 isoform X1 [Ciona intestinalis]
MSDFDSSVIEVPSITRRRSRIESNTSGGSGDVIIIESPTEGTNARATRRRRRSATSGQNEIVDLTCATETSSVSVDLVDLTLTPSDRSSNSRTQSRERTPTTQRRSRPLSNIRRSNQSQPTPARRTDTARSSTASASRVMIPPETPTVIDPRFQNLPEINCPVCLETLKTILSQGNEIRSTVCGHVFCHNCISLAIRSSKKCPTCRRKLTLKNVHPLYLTIT